MKIGEHLVVNNHGDQVLQSLCNNINFNLIFEHVGKWSRNISIERRALNPLSILFESSQLDFGSESYKVLVIGWLGCQVSTIEINLHTIVDAGYY